MTDEARIARLTELARQVWSDAEVGGGTSRVLVETASEWGNAIDIQHPRALDALEAALLVLADEDRIPLTADQVTRDALESCRRDREALTKRIREERAAMEQLASEWEQHDPLQSDVMWRRAVEHCARELREAAAKLAQEGS